MKRSNTDSATHVLHRAHNQQPAPFSSWLPSKASWAVIDTAEGRSEAPAAQDEHWKGHKDISCLALGVINKVTDRK